MKVVIPGGTKGSLVDGMFAVRVSEILGPETSLETLSVLPKCSETSSGLRTERRQRVDRENNTNFWDLAGRPGRSGHGLARASPGSTAALMIAVGREEPVTLEGGFFVVYAALASG